MLRSIALIVFAAAAACGAAPKAANSGPVVDPIQQVVFLQHVDAKDVVDALMELGMPYQVTIAEAPGDDSILVSGDNKSVQQVLKVIASVDKPAR